MSVKAVERFVAGSLVWVSALVTTALVEILRTPFHDVWRNVVIPSALIAFAAVGVLSIIDYLYNKVPR